MKISEMSREELIAHMRGNGSIHRPDRDSNEWKRAFALARLSGYENLEMDCTKCIDKVKQFLEK